MKIRTKYFPVGSSYYPPFHAPEDWERDLVNMAKIGLNQIRTAELLATWDYIEPKRGEPEWDWLDQTFELGAKHGIDIVLGTGSASPPIWMIENYPDLQRVSREGVLYPTNAVWGWACQNHPGLRSEVRRYVSLLLERYSQHPNLFVWQIDNQIGHHTAFSGGDLSYPRKYAYFCYCDHCARLFREWVQAKYQDIDRLNEAWSWDPTHYRYYDWHQIEPPRSMPAEWGNGTAWLDFRRFVRGNFKSYVQFQNDLIKDYDENQLTMTNLYHPLRPDLGARSEPNHWEMAGVVDVIGEDLYPTENKFWKDPNFSSLFYDFAYSVAHHNNRTLWVPEIESGPIGGFAAGPRYATKALDIKRFVMEAIGHGAKQILYMGYRDWNSIPLTWGGLVDFHGQPNDRYHMAGDLNRVIQAHEDFFLDALPPAAEIGLFYSSDNVILLDGQTNEHFLYRALRGGHQALWHAGFNLEFVTADHLGTDTANYKTLLLPFLMHMPQETADKLTEFVAQGGTLLGFAKLGHVDEGGWAWNDRPGAALPALFGARETLIETFEEPDEALAIQVEAGNPLFAGVEADTVQGYWHRQTFDLSGDVEVLARFSDGAPAIIRRNHGQGQAILVATHLDIAAWERQDRDAEQLLANLAALSGAQARIAMHGADQEYIDHWLDAHVLIDGETQALMLNNNGKQAADLKLTLHGAAHVTEAKELFSEKALAFENDQGLHFSLHLPAWEAVVILLT
jgi:beta-galactosidase GanA